MAAKKKSAMEVVKKLFPIVFYVFLIVFIIVYVKNIDFSKLASAHVIIQLILAAGVIDLLNRYWTVHIWVSILKGLGATRLSDKVGLTYVYAKSWLGRYIPGTAPWILGKIYFASRHGISKHKLAVSSVLEAALQIIVMVAVSLFSLVIDPRMNAVPASTKSALALLFLVCIIFLVPSFFNRFISWAYRIIKHDKLASEHFATRTVIFRGVALYFVSSVLNGLVFFLVARAVYPPLEWVDLLYVMAIGNLSGALGMLAIFVPSGIGVREGVQLLLLGLIMPTEFAAIIAVLARLQSVVVDLAFFAIARMSVFLFKPKQVETHYN